MSIDMTPTTQFSTISSAQSRSSRSESSNSCPTFGKTLLLSLTLFLHASLLRLAQ